MATIIENKDLSIENVANEENFVTMSRPSFEATIGGTKYEISGRAFDCDVVEDIEILNLETLENVIFEDEVLNEDIYSILIDIASHPDFLTL